MAMTLIFVLACALLLLAGVALSYSRLASAAPADAFDDGWGLEFDPRRYAVLTRLASDSDLRAARNWAGLNPQIEKRIRRRRASAAAAYLREMRADFRRLETVGRMMVLAGGTSMEFRQNLVEAKFRFTIEWWRVRLQFMLWSLGLGRFNPAGLVAAFDRFVSVAGPLRAASAEI
jgi:hypothetical protein